MLIGLGEREREGLYWFRGLESPAAMHTSVPADLHLWHSRLGHPSPRITSLVPGISRSSMTRCVIPEL